MTVFDADTFAAEIETPVLRQVFAYWRGKAGSHAMPRRADIDPLEIHFALGYIILVDIERTPLRFRFRLDGSALVRQFGEDFTGRYADELQPPDYAAYVEGLYRAALESGVPQHYARTLETYGQRFEYDVLILPLADAHDAAQIGMLMLAMIPKA